jgi:CheY-like chemotaxis protein
MAGPVAAVDLNMAISDRGAHEPKALMPSRPPLASSGAKTHMILVVEDDDTMRAMLSKMLGEKYRVFDAADGIAALDLLARIPTPDAILLDVMMPRVDGFELARRIKADPRLQRVPFLFLTARTGVLDITAGINTGARHYLAKPFKMPDLLARLDRMVVPRG